MRCPHCLFPAVWDGEILTCECGAAVRGRSAEPAYGSPPELKPDESNRLRGHLSDALEVLDGELAAGRQWVTERTAALADLGRRIVAFYRHTERGSEAAAHDRRRHPHFHRLLVDVVLAHLEVLVIEVKNEMHRLGGDAEAMLRMRPRRTEAFAGRRHAVAVALGHEGSSPIGLGSPTPGVGAPPPDTDRSVRGEARAIGAIDAQRAIGRARVGVQLDANGHVVDHGRPIPAPWLRLLMLVDWGQERKRAVVRRRSVDLAVEPLRLPDALDVVRREHGGEEDCPTTLHEARLALRRARAAVDVALLERRLVPPTRRRARAAAAIAETA